MDNATQYTLRKGSKLAAIVAALARSVGTLSTGELARMLGRTMSEQNVSSGLATLHARGFVDQFGQRRSYRWSNAGRFTSDPETGLPPNEYGQQRYTARNRPEPRRESGPGPCPSVLVFNRKKLAPGARLNPCSRCGQHVIADLVCHGEIK